MPHVEPSIFLTSGAFLSSPGWRVVGLEDMEHRGLTEKSDIYTMGREDFHLQKAPWGSDPGFGTRVIEKPIIRRSSECCVRGFVWTGLGVVCGNLYVQELTKRLRFQL